jgi:hypothetical protein
LETANNTLIVGCKKTKIPNNTISISDSAFFYCSGLESITIPKSVNTISDYAFYGCI